MDGRHLTLRVPPVIGTETHPLSLSLSVDPVFVDQREKEDRSIDRCTGTVPVSSDWPHASDSKAAGKMLCAHREKSLILNQGKITIRHKNKGQNHMGIHVFCTKFNTIRGG